MGKRAKAIWDMDLELEYVKYMLKISPEDAKEIALRIDNSIP